ncbi:MAG: TolC family protein [Myxococcales bacterium]|nr:TolC family protein [Myxococcales bacterium]MCB9714021.1 TolC family protein [Myxococcales bacterium]
MLGGCADPLERSTATALAEVDAELRPLDEPEAPLEFTTRTSVEGIDGSLPHYLAYAYAHRPALRASFERWRAAAQRPRQARRLPEPQITFTAFVRPVETRVGPQRLKLGAMQWFPWPSKLGAAGRAAAHEAQAEQRHFEADALAVAAEVSTAYWTLWEIRRTRAVDQDELTILRSLTEQVRVQLEVSGADLADVARLELMSTRAEDRLAGLDERERMAAAELVRVIGAPPGTAVPTDAREPAVELPRDEAVLHLAAIEHPRVQAWASLSEAAQLRERSARAERLPSFGVGVDWIITGQPADANAGHVAPAERGKDAVMVTAGVKVPLWGRAYGAAASEARANDAAHRARALEARNMALAELERSLARVRDGARRTALLESTLVPQAEAAFESVTLSYASGRSSIGELMMSERDLLELQRERVAAYAALGIAWAELERVVGRPLTTSEGGEGQ